MASTSFLAVFSIFRFASFAKNLEGEDDDEFFFSCECFAECKCVPVCHFLLSTYMKKGSGFLHTPIDANVTSFDHAKAFY